MKCAWKTICFKLVQFKKKKSKFKRKKKMFNRKLLLIYSYRKRLISLHRFEIGSGRRQSIQLFEHAWQYHCEIVRKIWKMVLFVATNDAIDVRCKNCLVIICVLPRSRCTFCVACLLTNMDVFFRSFQFAHLMHMPVCVCVVRIYLYFVLFFFFLFLFVCKRRNHCCVSPIRNILHFLLILRSLWHYFMHLLIKMWLGRNSKEEEEQKRRQIFCS